MNAPPNRCKFVSLPDNGNEYCCYRVTAEDDNRCAWHQGVDNRGTADVKFLAHERPPGLVSTEEFEPRERLDGSPLRGANLRGLDLRGFSFRSADLRDADLTDADLRSADLTSVNLQDATLINADLRDATLCHADLYDASLYDADIRNADLRGADLSDADLRDARMSGVDLTDATMQAADCTHTSFRGADLTGADLEGSFLNRADLFGANFTDARLYGAVFRTARANPGTVIDDYCVYDPSRDGDSPNAEEESPGVYMRSISTYQEIEKLCAENALLEAHSRYFVRRQDVHTLIHRAEGRWGRWLRARASRAFVLYGESPFRVLCVTVSVILFSTLVYPLGYLREGATGELLLYPSPAEPVAFVHTLLNSFYFAALSFTTMTYGEYAPVGPGKFLAIFETGSGIVLMALLVFVFGRRATR